MVKLGTKTYRSKSEQAAYESSIAGKYMKLLKKNHFVFFGLPFMLSIVAGSIYLQKFTAVKWEKFDEKYQQVSEKEALSILNNKREFNAKEDYYRLQGFLQEHEEQVSDDYEIVRVARAKEDEPVWWRSG